jgi:hypothetical protein
MGVFLTEPRRRLKCKAKNKKTGERCGKWANDGYEVCTVHGAGTKKRVAEGTRKSPAESGLKTGRYSKLKSDRFRNLIEQHEADGNPLDILPELAAARAVFEDFVNRYDEYTNALLAWHKSFENHPKIMGVKMIEALTNVIEQCENIASRDDELEPQLEEDLNASKAFIEAEELH